MRAGIRALLGAVAVGGAPGIGARLLRQNDITEWLQERASAARRERRGSPAEQQRRQDAAIAKRQRKGARRRSERAGFANVVLRGGR